MAEETRPPKVMESFPLFTFSKANQAGQSFGLSGSLKKLPPPPCVEVAFSEPDSGFVPSLSDSIVIGDGHHGLTLFKGRVNTSDVFGVSNSDLVPGTYEGGLKLWEGSIDLVKSLRNEIDEGRLNVNGKRVLELGCGHGLPGIFAGLQGAASIHFQDFNVEVLRFLTVPNVYRNLIYTSTQSHPPKDNVPASSNVRFFAGDWSDVHQLLLPRFNDCQNEVASVTECDTSDAYDIILMAETVYSLSSLHSLYELTKKCLQYPQGVVYMAGKKHYFGVGGGTRHFVRLVENDGKMRALLLAEVADGSSNIREVWKLSYK
ncbi:hypothetical protein HPP92_022948 [Vanilla planifolia]|uniref:protein-histidine N-methyltransferase n=1 Tax=Vanilla planifolia TaxID=51239 RepID=A0A835PPG0_VANPL|nr:hypothetical protein HPP92_022948 [Vanilla planifolia]